MKQSDAKKLFIQYTNDKFEQWNFKEKKNRRAEAIYIRIKENGFEDIGVSTTNYYPDVVFGMGSGKRINIIEEILWDINEQYRLELNLVKNESTTLSYWGFHQQTRRIQLLDVENKDNELGVQESTAILMNFIENELLPAYDLFDDLRELDKRINGEGENWGSEKKEMSLGQYFGYRRHIIVRLCKNESEFENYFIKYTDELNVERVKNNRPAFRRDNLEEVHVKIFNYLKENVSPMY